MTCLGMLLRARQAHADSLDINHRFHSPRFIFLFRKLFTVTGTPNKLPGLCSTDRMVCWRLGGQVPTSQAPSSAPQRHAAASATVQGRKWESLLPHCESPDWTGKQCAVALCPAGLRGCEAQVSMRCYSFAELTWHAACCAGSPPAAPAGPVPLRWPAGWPAPAVGRRCACPAPRQLQPGPPPGQPAPPQSCLRGQSPSWSCWGVGGAGGARRR